MIKLPIDKKTLLRFLGPVSRLGDKSVVKMYKDKIYTLATSDDNNIILYAAAAISDNTSADVVRLNIADVKKFLRAVECFEEDLHFYLKNNHIYCETSELNGAYFKYHLVDDSIIKETPISVEKISNLNFDTEFNISNKKLSEISRGSSYAVDTQKIYFYTKDGAVFSELTDHTIQNIDSITLRVADTYVGQPIKGLLPLMLEIFRNLTSLKCENVKVKINNENKVIMFCVTDNSVELKYIISTLVK